MSLLNNEQLKNISAEEEKSMILKYFSRLKILFPLYCFLNIKIKTKEAIIERLKFNKLQKKLWQLVKYHLDNNLPIRFYFIKSRQTGSTTFWLALIFWFTTLWKNRNAILLAHDDDTSSGLGDKFQNYYLRSNPLLKPEARKVNRDEVYFATSLKKFNETQQIGHDCHIDNQTAQKANLGRSYTYQYALLSEFGVWEENGIDIKTVLSPLLQTIPKLPNTAIIIETTLKNPVYAKEFWEDKSNGFMKVFISYIADDTYRKDLPFGQYFDLNDTDEVTGDNPLSKYGNEHIVIEKIKEELIFWDSENLYKDNPIALHHEAMCRIAWRRETIDEKCFSDVNVFRQEYPLTVEDAFSTSSSYVFPIAKIEEQTEKAKLFKTVLNYNFDFTTQEFYEYKHGKLKVFEQPQQGQLYVIGGDGAQGIKGADFSSLCVLRLPELYEVASFQDIIAPTDYADVAYHLSKWYNNAQLGIEINDKGGFAAVESIRDKYPRANLYFRKELPTNGKVDNKAPTVKDVRYGWHTNEITRSIMIEDLNMLLKSNGINIYNTEILEQLRSFIKHKNGKLAAATGKHDDLVLALMIAVQMARNIQIQRDEKKVKTVLKGSLDWHMRRMEQRRRSGLRMRVS